MVDIWLIFMENAWFMMGNLKNRYGMIWMITRVIPKAGWFIGENILLKWMI